MVLVRSPGWFRSRDIRGHLDLSSAGSPTRLIWAQIVQRSLVPSMKALVHLRWRRTSQTAASPDTAFVSPWGLGDRNFPPKPFPFPVPYESLYADTVGTTATARSASKILTASRLEAAPITFRLVGKTVNESRQVWQLSDAVCRGASISMPGRGDHAL